MTTLSVEQQAAADAVKLPSTYLHAGNPNNSASPFSYYNSWVSPAWGGTNHMQAGRGDSGFSPNMNPHYNGAPVGSGAGERSNNQFSSAITQKAAHHGYLYDTPDLDIQPNLQQYRERYGIAGPEGHSSKTQMGFGMVAPENGPPMMRPPARPSRYAQKPVLAGNGKRRAK